MEKKRTAAAKRAAPVEKSGKPTEAKGCGLCGKTKKLTQTLCCENWVCDDGDRYVLFSYARSSCHRNHDRYTLCSFHYHEHHTGDWRKCRECRREFEAKIYVYYGTNEYNFVKLDNPPKYKPTLCAVCSKVIKLGEGGYSQRGKDHYCMACSGSVR